MCTYQQKTDKHSKTPRLKRQTSTAKTHRHKGLTNALKHIDIKDRQAQQKHRLSVAQ